MKKKATPKPKRRTKKELQEELPPLSLFIRNRREELGYTQEELAFRTGLSTRFVKEFERGKKTVRLDKVMELLEFMGATLEPKLRSRS
ncbi:helix-turn-helix protein [compost metagenome]